MRFTYDCVQRTNIQNLKAIHNFRCLAANAVRLCSKNEYTKSESNSQLMRRPFLLTVHCVQRTNIQNLKAIHNYMENVIKYMVLCSKNEYTKSESNSQPVGSSLTILSNCVQRTNIQNLKAIHNVLFIGCLFRQYCVQRTNIQNLKAIHNVSRYIQVTTLLCSKNEYTKSESNSQRQ